jgi:hypothetical protein
MENNISIPQKNKWTSKDFVITNAEIMKGFEYPDFVKVGCEFFNSRARYSAYKKAVKSVLDIDLEVLKNSYCAAKLEAMEAEITHSISLYSDATASKFGIVNDEGEPVWFGRFFDSEGGEQSRGEMDAAKKAIWLAGKIARERGVHVGLLLFADAQWLTYANGHSGGGKAAGLRQAAQKAGIALHVSWLPSRQNLADHYSRCKGFQKWQDGIDKVEVKELKVQGEPTTWSKFVEFNQWTD